MGEVTFLAATSADGAPRVYYLNGDLQVFELAWSDGRWHSRNVSYYAGDAPPPMENSELTAISADGARRVYYEVYYEDGCVAKNQRGMRWA